MRHFHDRLNDLLWKRTHSRPPVSLLGQLYWREFYYVAAMGTPNYGKMVGNPLCLQVDWRLRDGWSDPKDPAAEKDLLAWCVQIFSTEKAS